MAQVQVNGVVVDETSVLEFVPNNKRMGTNTWHRHEAYAHCTTLAEYLETMAEEGYAKFAIADLKYNEAFGHVTIRNADGEIISKAAEKTKRLEEAKLKIAKSA